MASRTLSRAGKADHAPMGMHAVSVERVRRLTPHLVRITLAAPSLAAFQDDGPDQRFKLLLPRPGQRRPLVPDAESWYQAWQAMPEHERPVMRTYTIRKARPEAGEVDVDVVLHGDSGPASAWASRVTPGDEVAIYAAYGEHDPPPDAAWQLIAADHTALPAAAAILERLPETGVPVIALIAVADAGEELSLQAPPGVGLRWLHTVPGRPGRALREAVAATPLPAGPGYAWVCADTETVKGVRRDLVTHREMPAERVMFMGYWRTDGPIDRS